MILCPDQHLAVLLPWKTASQTLKKRLGHLNHSPYPDYYYFNSTIGRVVHQHITLSDFQQLPECRPETILAVFVRNPYDRVFSGFLQMVKDLKTQPRRMISDPLVRRQVLSQLQVNFDGLKAASYDFNQWFQNLPDYFFYDRARNTSLPLHPITAWTHSAGVLRAQFVGRVESFEFDFQRLCRRFNLENVGQENENVSFDGLASLPAIAGKCRYLHFFQSNTIARVNEVFGDDFKYFGYQTERDARA